MRYTVGPAMQRLEGVLKIRVPWKPYEWTLAAYYQLS